MNDGKQPTYRQGHAGTHSDSARLADRPIIARGQRAIRAWHAVVVLVRMATVGIVLLATGQVGAAEAQAPLPTVTVQAGIHVIRAELAATPEAQARGLMFRARLDGNNGMLFAFDVASRQCFWMRNTLIPLSIAFIDDDGSIVDIAAMAPRSDETHCSSRAVRFALEMPEAWFEKRGIAPGSRLRSPGLFGVR